MAGFFKSFWSLVTYRKRARLESESQLREGYSVTYSPDGHGEYIEYREGDKFLSAVLLEYEGGRRKLHASTLKEWDEPVKGEPLTLEELELVVERIRQYLFRVQEVDEVILDDSPVVPMDELFENMGWEAKQDDGLLVYIPKSHKTTVA